MAKGASGRSTGPEDDDEVSEDEPVPPTSNARPVGTGEAEVGRQNLVSGKRDRTPAAPQEPTAPQIKNRAQNKPATNSKHRLKTNELKWQGSAAQAAADLQKKGAKGKKAAQPALSDDGENTADDSDCAEVPPPRMQVAAQPHQRTAPQRAYARNPTQEQAKKRAKQQDDRTRHLRKTVFNILVETHRRMYGDQGIRGARVPRRLRSEPCICDLNRLFDAFFRNITIQILSRIVTRVQRP